MSNARFSLATLVVCFLSTFAGCYYDPQDEIDATEKDGAANSVKIDINSNNSSSYECVEDENCDEFQKCDQGKCVPCPACKKNNNPSYDVVEEEETEPADPCANVNCPADSSCRNYFCEAGECKWDNLSGTCSDGKSWTSNDRCLDGECVGDPECEDAGDCPDSNDCTIDSCGGGQCFHEEKKVGTPCDDGNSQTENDVCTTVGANVECIGEVIYACTEDNAADKCDDDNECTVEKCIGNACVNAARTGECEGSDSSKYYTCQQGVCTEVTCENSCDDGNVCTVDSCDKGNCVHTADSNGLSCSDNDPYTFNEHCENGTCVVEYGDCVNDNECSAPVCKKGGCANHNCSEQDLPSGTPCNDNNPATVNDQCNGAGVCWGELNVCTSNSLDCDDDNPCTDDICNPATGCGHNYNNVPCEDGDNHTKNDFCMGGDCIPGEYNCLYDSECSDGKVCTSDKCSQGACLFSAIEGCCTYDSDCNDYNSSTTDKCVANKCTYVPKECVGGCDDNKVCTVDSCNIETGTCSHVAIQGCCDSNDDCGDSNACTTDTCNVFTGVCSHSNVSNCCNYDSECSDGNLNTIDKCVANVCTHTVAGCVVNGCNDGNVCTSGYCNSSTGVCSYSVISGCCIANADCNDFNPNTTDICDQYNTCHNDVVAECDSAADCNDGDVCTDDACHFLTGQCVHTEIAGCCTDDTDCSSGLCYFNQCINTDCFDGMVYLTVTCPTPYFVLWGAEWNDQEFTESPHYTSGSTVPIHGYNLKLWNQPSVAAQGISASGVYSGGTQCSYSAVDDHGKKVDVTVNTTFYQNQSGKALVIMSCGAN